MTSNRNSELKFKKLLIRKPLIAPSLLKNVDAALRYNHIFDFGFLNIFVHNLFTRIETSFKQILVYSACSFTVVLYFHSALVKADTRVFASTTKVASLNGGINIRVCCQGKLAVAINQYR